MPKISVVLPSYNGEKYIRDAVDSVLAQTFQDWELIIVNDCSTDRTPEIVEEYAASDARIRVIHNAVNQKLPESLNIGFRQARGDYLTWTSDDNVYLSRALEVMCQYLDDHGQVPMVCARMLLMNADMQYLMELEGYNEYSMYTGNSVGASFLYRREILEEVGEYSTELFCVEDYDYWVRILQRYGGIHCIKEVLYLYRLQPRSLTTVKAKEIQHIQGRMKVKHLDWILSGICKDELLLMRLYNELAAVACVSEAVKNRFADLVPELRGEEALTDAADVVIYGAGKYGEKACERIRESAIAFADSDEAKIGTSKFGLPILSANDLKDLYRTKRSQILIAVRYERQLEIMRQLQDLGITRYTIITRVTKEL